jgi:1-acyl-sn-glycerol-3-phosphate acyltransferase
MPSPPPKPISDIWRPELTCLPPLTRTRRAFRAFARGLMKTLVVLCLRPVVQGMENFPKTGSVLVVVNHLGDADSALLLSELPFAADALGKVELYSFPVLGKLMDWYGIIWLHRGRPDRRAMHAALQGLAEGRTIVMAPEGRYTRIGGLEEGGHGAAFLALKADVPILPMALTGTQNEYVYGHLRRLRRAPVTLTVGRPFRLAARADRRQTLRQGTRQIMETLADLLPPEYRGAYESRERG